MRNIYATFCVDTYSLFDTDMKNAFFSFSFDKIVIAKKNSINLFFAALGMGHC